MIEVWMHKETGEIVLAANLFTEQKYDAEIMGHKLCSSYYQELGYGIEPKDGVMLLYPDSIKDQFEVIGEW